MYDIRDEEHICTNFKLAIVVILTLHLHIFFVEII